MALYKEVRQSDGVTTTYHRVLSVTMTTNRQNSIAVLSYVSGESREDEKMSTEGMPYVRSVTYETAYDPEMTVTSAYEYLKTLPRFEGAMDV